MAVATAIEAGAPRVIRMDLEYDGTEFRGFAPQPRVRTVGGELEVALTRVCGEQIRVTPGGRTDSGVHATGQVVSFQTSSRIPQSDLRRAVNALVGQDLFIKDCREANAEFDARRSAQTRRYGYTIWNAPGRHVRYRRWMGHVATLLDADRMHAACQALPGKHDFAAFRTHKSQDPPGLGTVRRVHSASWFRDDMEPEVIRFEIEAEAFLRHMVRTIVGSSILVGQGKLPIDAIHTMLARGERAGAGPTAPPHGLTLLEVTY